MSDNLDMISLLENKFGDKIQIQQGTLEAGAIIANNGLHHDVLKALH
jgi:hypothetical protein